MSGKLDILFAANDSIALRTLQEVCGSFNVVGVLSGKGRAEPQISAFAKEMGLPVLTPERLSQAERDQVSALGANFLLSFSISRIFGPKFLSLFSKGSMNIHPSLLPSLRGPSPIQYSILEGLERSGISFQSISLGMDEGDIYHSVLFDIAHDDDTLSLREKVSLLASQAVCDVLRNHLDSRTAQSGEASYSRQISKDDGRVDFQNDSAVRISRKVRAYCIWPKCYCYFNGELLFFESVEADGAAGLRSDAKPGTIIGFDSGRGSMNVATVDGVLRVMRLRKDKRKSMGAMDFYNGNRKLLSSGVVLE